MTFVKRYQWFLIILAAWAILFTVNRTAGLDALSITGNSLLDMISLLPPILIFVGLLDIWIKKETLMKYMGPGSGMTGTGIAFLLGSISAGPLYVAFPVAAMLLKKGVLVRNVVFFLGVWTVAKLPILIYEVASLGLTFTVIHVASGLVFFYFLGIWFERMFKQDKLLQYDPSANT
ncbi:permease [Salisediminibacterium beveridgei]|uniref:Permease n=1 Tax=Salisediminibacterium beveridgei TaxID=632773 RepID=A0A1D7QS03_9BACI|nr:permease [Salisediminibacterium beveridgei]AOM81790.1 hypothetical protein BBEV_0396 [Salisediminibacterium beveridgei]